MFRFWSPKRLARMALVVLSVATGLAACGPRTLRTWVSPESYSTDVTLDFLAPDGPPERQTQRYTCRILDASDSLAPIISLEQEGSPFWRRGVDGSITVVGDLRPCRWADRPKRGLAGALGPLPTRSARGNVFFGDTYVFDSATAPSKVDVLVTDQLFAPDYGRLQNAAFAIKRQRRSDDLESGFPGLADLRAQTPPVNIVSGLEPGVFSGVAAKAYSLSGLDCGGEPRILTIPNACLAWKDCTPAVTTGCSTYLGSMRVTFDARFGRGEVRPETLDRLYSMSLYKSSLIAAASPPLRPSYMKDGPQAWAPEICHAGLCATVGLEPIYFYDPQAGLLVEVGRFSTSFHNGFSKRDYVFAALSEAVAYRQRAKG
jgi:hypothetical protein